MLPVTFAGRMLVVAVLALTAGAPALQAQSAQDTFYHAYYLQHAKHDVVAAAELYAQVATARGVDADLKAEARAHLSVCQEELATVDFARLMPPNPIAYAELNRPGQRLRQLIDQLGLLARADGRPAPGENRLAISPAVIDAVLGMRGVAAAVTGFDMAAERPSGVVVFHPGDVELVRGLIETALPIPSEQVAAIGGYPTYDVEGEVLVTLTARLVIAGTSRGEIEGVIERLQDPDAESLATNKDLAEVLADRQDALLFACVNPKPLMPLLNGLMAAGATQNRHLAIAQALVDLKSFQSLSGRFDVSDQGLLAEVTLRLDEGHRNLVYNFLRGPAIDADALRCIPSGAAGFVALALNDAPASYGESGSQSDAQPIVTALDIGREIFANINGIAVYALPPDGSERQGRYPIPDVAASITVNDPAKSRALWSQMLGIASLASGGGFSLEGLPLEIEGVAVQSYRFQEGVTVYFATDGHHLLIGSSETAMARSLRAKRSGKSVLDDAAFTQAMKRVGPHATLAALAHPARCAEIAKPFMSAGEIAEMEPFLGPLAQTVVCAVVNHSDQTLRISAALTGVPNIGPLVSELIAAERLRDKRQRRLASAVRRADWGAAARLLDDMLVEEPDNDGLLKSKFNLLAVRTDNHAGALAFADELYDRWADNANALNNFAWNLLTDDKYQSRYNEVALRFSRRSNELTGNSSWAYLDTLALAEFEAGNVERAIDLQEKALELCQRRSQASVPAVEKALARYRAAGGVE